LGDPSDLWFALGMLVVAVASGGWFAFRWLHLARLIEDTPTSRIRSAAQGYVELAGRGRPLGGTSNLAPLTQRPCVWWRYRIQRRVSSGSGSRRRTKWQAVTSGRSGQPFLVDDGTGECIVQPEGAEVVAGESTTWYGDTPWPTEAPGARRSLLDEREYRYFEERIYENEQVYALGQFRTLSADSQRDLDTEVAALLVEWKQDQTALAERFDADRDGRVSLEEWERVRTDARHAVVAHNLERPRQPARNVLGRPQDGHLFMIAALPQADVARRYRRRAAAAFVGFTAAVYALGWLLQGAFTAS
jgi:hypothetical protein